MGWGEKFFSVADFTPHGFCLLWDPALVWTYFLSDATIALAYFSIPAALWVIASRRPDLNPHGVLLAFAAFIVMCGLTHVMAMVTLWLPLYGLSGVIKAITALVSIVTAALIWKLLQAILHTPRAVELAAANDELVRLNASLETRVAERTQALQESNAQLLRTAIEAREGERVKHDFLARVSHELRTPLNAILGFNDLMRTGISGTLSDKHMEYSESVNVAAQHLLQEINDVLDLERLSDPANRLSLEQVDLSAEIEQIVRLNQSASGGHRAKVRINILEGFQIRADRHSIVVIMGNLVSNAIKYSLPGGETDIRARALPSSGLVEITVADRGIGIPANRLSDIFTPFVRAHETELPAVGGTGLGLSIVKMLVEMHGGEIRVASAPGEGTTMTVLLPIDPAPLSAAGSELQDLKRMAVEGFGIDPAGSLASAPIPS